LFAIAYYFGKIGSLGTFFSLFGGMLLGWSLQTPITGFMAWILVSLKRPFRPGDRVQFPTLGLTGDVKTIGAMYTILDQVGGSVGSEEAVGRNILIPNPMLFSQVIINYTVVHEASYILDEVVVRITYDSNWARAEEILLKAANGITGDIINVTGQKPYIRSDLYDYGVYMRLRYQTRVKDRAEISYRISRCIFEEIQKVPTVDIAIPFIYSFRAAMEDKEANKSAASNQVPAAREIEIGRIQAPPIEMDSKEVDRVATSIGRHGLLQPIIVLEQPGNDKYEILAGHIRYSACRQLGWSTITAIVRSSSY
jgi:small-conductance mechanosensitive channel